MPAQPPGRLSVDCFQTRRLPGSSLKAVFG
jgi:hypothetical protein